jgi:thiosulfate/3-mercaptopyruvate sulfurtransferase
MFKTLIESAALADRLSDDRWVVVDCRFDLADPPKGEQLYRQSHIPGARYAHLDRDLSGEKTGTNGRHPLPTPDQMRDRFGALGIGPGTQVVAYDGDNGMYAARLWWMLRFMGHEAVAVLDGGFGRWTGEGRPVRGGAEQWQPVSFQGTPRLDWLIDAAQILAGLDSPTLLLVDARAESRFRGENETIDRVAGHIPGARNFFFHRNLTPDKKFRSVDELRAEWLALLGGTPTDDTVMYCGSGVTACHNLLALEHAGLTGARLYPGSWSEWSSNPQRPIATGAT